MSDLAFWTCYLHSWACTRGTTRCAGKRCHVQAGTLSIAGRCLPRSFGGPRVVVRVGRKRALETTSSYSASRRLIQAAFDARKISLATSLLSLHRLPFVKTIVFVDLATYS
ncbi:hypothetical protein K458DRAFT_416858 [Lentithecium fluviatile CBS 122367]|uniref:Uncharacterized protein n=1 Tax=Lentithecium fluviatile CBS 122367 TaxID=1168545 RepID=A0A6G1J5X2_9PLEO|nr:hypothetical protein K458DRAFT_416858 [Lentithecium fluviatile CBS 122367]